MKKGFDNDKYLAMQSEHIRERIQQFDNKLYLEFGGKLYDDYHASRVLPGFEPDSKLRMLMQLADQALRQLPNLRGSQAHISRMLSAADEKTFQKLGVMFTSEAK